MHTHSNGREKATVCLSRSQFYESRGICWSSLVSEKVPVFCRCESLLKKIRKFQSEIRQDEIAAKHRVESLLSKVDSLRREHHQILAHMERLLQHKVRGGYHEQEPRTTVSQAVQTRFPVQLAFIKFLSKIKGIF